MEPEFLLSLEFLREHALEGARALESLAAGEAGSFLAAVPAETAAAPLAVMDAQAAANCLAAMPPARACAVSLCLPFDLAALYLRRMPAPAREDLLGALPAERREPLARVLGYPEGTAGALMDPQAFSLPEDVRAGEALERLHARLEHVVDYVYVVDRRQALVGMLTLRELMRAPAESGLAGLSRLPVRPLRPLDARAAIVEHPGWRVLHELPVAGGGGVFLGAVDYQTLRRLESDLARLDRPEPAKAAGHALGELYWIGLSGLWKSAAAAMEPRRAAGLDGGG